jgi:glycine/D-amino acid oxidase-like deaminating enzyme
MIATEPLAPETMARLMPKGRMLTDTKKLLSYYRPSPDGTRILFGGRAAYGNTDLRTTGRRLHRFMTNVYPELDGLKITHSWDGNVAFCFDLLPHTGCQAGVHYAIGYCGSGVAFGAYLGHKAGLKVLGDPDGATAFDDLPLQTRPFYSGKPWFLAGAVAYYKMRDRLAR